MQRRLGESRIWEASMVILMGVLGRRFGRLAVKEEENRASSDNHVVWDNRYKSVGDYSKRVSGLLC